MKLHTNSRKHPEIGRVTLRMLWIPAVAAIAITGYFALHMPQHKLAPAMAAATAGEMATQALRPTDDTTARTVMVAPDLPDESIVQQQELDPVGAGHDVAR